MVEKRREPRYMCSELVNVLIRHQDHRLEEAIANLEDISPSGACVQLEMAVEIGADIEIVCSKCSFKGKVRNCRYFEGGYDIGVAFTKPKAWSVERYRPAHLLIVETGLAQVGTPEKAAKAGPKAMGAGEAR